MRYYLNILGTFELRDADGAAVNSILQQPRRSALLVYLALADRDAMVKRDTLLGIFWPELTQEAGRRALSQAIHFLRRSLGSAAIIARGNEDIALNPELVACDAASFLAAVKAHDARTAATAYTGDLLPGFFISGTPEFDQWLSVTRESLRRTGADVFWSAAEEARQQGQNVTAATMARRAAELASDNESATRRLMEFLESIDDRAGALDAYDGLVRKLRAEFEATPSQKSRDLAERIRRNGHQLTQTLEPAATAIAGIRISRLPWTEIRNRSRTLAGAGILMVSFLSLWGLGTKMGRTATARTDASVVVAEAVTVDAALRDEASAIISDVSAALVAVPRLRVQARTFAAGDAASAHFLLKPSITSRGSDVYVVASLVDVESNTIVRSASFTAPANDAAKLSDLSQNMAEFARKAIGRHLRATNLVSSKTPDADALNQSVLARIRSDSLRSRGLAQYALLTLDNAETALDGALAEHRSAELFVEKAELAKEKVWVYLVPPLMNQAKATEIAAQGIKYADAAIQIDADNAAAQELRGLFAYNQWLSSVEASRADQYRDDAEKFLRRAAKLNPGAARAWSALSTILIAKGDFTNAYWAGEKAYGADTYLDVSENVTASLFRASLETSDLQAAERWCAEMSRRAGNNWAGAYCTLQLIAWGDKPSNAILQRADAIVNQVSNNAANAPFIPVLNSILAVVHAKSGDASRAIALVEASNTGPMTDEAQPFRAWALSVLDRKDEARTILNGYVQNSPSMRAGIARSARFAGL